MAQYDVFIFQVIKALAQVNSKPNTLFTVNNDQDGIDFVDYNTFITRINDYDNSISYTKFGADEKTHEQLTQYIKDQLAPGSHTHANKTEVLDTITEDVYNQINSKQDPLGFTPLNSALKDQADGYVSLDSSSKVSVDKINPLYNNPPIQFKVVQSLTELNALTADEVKQHDIVYVVDIDPSNQPQEDPAAYICTKSETGNAPVWTVFMQFNSNNIVSVNWEAISGVPTNTVQNIDDMVGKSHEHDNLETLDKFSAQDEKVKYDSKEILLEDGSNKARIIATYTQKINKDDPGEHTSFNLTSPFNKDKSTLYRLNYEGLKLTYGMDYDFDPNSTNTVRLLNGAKMNGNDQVHVTYYQSINSISKFIGIKHSVDGPGTDNWVYVDIEGNTIPDQDAKKILKSMSIFKIKDEVIDGQDMVKYPAGYITIIKGAPGTNLANSYMIGLSDGPIDHPNCTLHPAFYNYVGDGSPVSKFYLGKYLSTTDNGVQSTAKMLSKPPSSPSNLNYATINQVIGMYELWAKNRNVSGVTGFDTINIYQYLWWCTLCLMWTKSGNATRFLPGYKQRDNYEPKLGLIHPYYVKYQYISGFTADSVAYYMYKPGLGNRQQVRYIPNTYGIRTASAVGSYSNIGAGTQINELGFDLGILLFPVEPIPSSTSQTYGFLGYKWLKPTNVGVFKFGINVANSEQDFNHAALQVIPKPDYSGRDITSRLSKY